MSFSHSLCHSRAGGNPFFCHCEERSDAAIPSFHLRHSRENGNPSLCHCELAKGKCGNLIIPLYLSSFSFVLFLPTLIAYTITIPLFLFANLHFPNNDYSLFTNNLFIPAPLISFRPTLYHFYSHMSFPFHFCHSRESGNPSLPCFLIIFQYFKFSDKKSIKKL